jgi:hypothetical protein
MTRNDAVLCTVDARCDRKKGHTVIRVIKTLCLIMFAVTPFATQAVAAPLRSPPELGEVEAEYQVALANRCRLRSDSNCCHSVATTMYATSPLSSILLHFERNPICFGRDKP